MEKHPTVNLDILVIKEGKVLLGLLSKDWLYEGRQVYGVPGRDLKFRESIGDSVKRNIKEALDCDVRTYKIISVNANYAFDNHYIGIGVVAEIEGEPKHVKNADWETWEWFGLDKIPENLFPAAENVIRSYKEHKITVME